jgi:succinyl-CoA synthetase alpha subunit
MTILVNNKTRVLVQGMTGREGASHTVAMKEYGTNVVAGVTPGKGGQNLEGIPIFDLVSEAKSKIDGVNTSIIFVPAPFVSDAVFEAIEADIKLIIIITEHVPVHDAMDFVAYAQNKGVTIIGPNCPGVISPGESKVGIMPGHIFKKGKVGMVSRSGTLTYEIAWVLTKKGLGQSTAVGIGGDPVIGTDFVSIVEMFEEDRDTSSIVVVGEIGGDAEERLALKLRRDGIKKPIVAFVAGRTAPPGKRMGHAGAIISMGSGTAQGKIDALQSAGVPVAPLPSDIPTMLMNFDTRQMQTYYE